MQKFELYIFACIYKDNRNINFIQNTLFNVENVKKKYKKYSFK